jgi:hypothetical protein
MLIDVLGNTDRQVGRHKRLALARHGTGDHDGPGRRTGLGKEDVAAQDLEHLGCNGTRFQKSHQILVHIVVELERLHQVDDLGFAGLVIKFTDGSPGCGS